MDALNRARGAWTGTSVLQDPHQGIAQESASRLEVTPLLGGRFVRLDYDWEYGGERQEGSMLVGPADTVYWIDTWHMGATAMLCRGEGLKVRGSYPAGDGPDWGWRIDLEPGDAELRVFMANVDPEGNEMPAVEARYRRA